MPVSLSVRVPRVADGGSPFRGVPWPTTLLMQLTRISGVMAQGGRGPTQDREVTEELQSFGLATDEPLAHNTSSQHTHTTLTHGLGEGCFVGPRRWLGSSAERPSRMVASKEARSSTPGAVEQYRSPPLPSQRREAAPPVNEKSRRGW